MRNRGWTSLSTQEYGAPSSSTFSTARRQVITIAIFLILLALALGMGLGLGLNQSNSPSHVRVSECNRPDLVCPEHSICVLLNPGHACICESGFQFANLTNTTCVNVDECDIEENACDLANLTCIDEIGSFTCNCSIEGGYEWNADHLACEDINECAVAEAENTSLCPLHETCYNTNGSYYCNCTGALFEFEGQNPSDSTLFSCRCYAYDDVSCRFKDPCDRPENACLDGAVCGISEGGSTFCACPVHEIYNDTNCISICDTTISPCGNGTCVFPSEVQCICSDRLVYSGLACNETCFNFTVFQTETCNCSEGYIFVYADDKGCLPDPCLNVSNLCTTLSNATGCFADSNGDVACNCSTGFVFSEGSCQDWCVLHPSCNETGGVCNATAQSCACPEVNDDNTCYETCHPVPSCEETNGTCILNEPNTLNVSCSCPGNQTYYNGCVDLCTLVPGCEATNGTCALDPESGVPTCLCLDGFAWNGEECATRCNDFSHCEDSGGTCHVDPETFEPICTCPEGLILACLV